MYRVAKHGEAWILGPVGSLSDLLIRKDKIIQNCKNINKTPPSDWPVTRGFLVAKNNEEAHELASKYIFHYMSINSYEIVSIHC